MTVSLTGIECFKDRMNVISWEVLILGAELESRSKSRKMIEHNSYQIGVKVEMEGE